MLESVFFHKVIRHLGLLLYQKETQKQVLPLNTAKFLETPMLKNIYERLLLLYGQNLDMFCKKNCQKKTYKIHKKVTPVECNFAPLLRQDSIASGSFSWAGCFCMAFLIYFFILNLRIKHFVSLYFHACISHWYCRNSVWSFRYFEFFMYSSQ